MLRNMCVSLLQHEAIKTTVPKAKELRRVVEPLITLSKIPSVANRRLASRACVIGTSSPSCSMNSGRVTRPGRVATHAS